MTKVDVFSWAKPYGKVAHNSIERPADDLVIDSSRDLKIALIPSYSISS